MMRSSSFWAYRSGVALIGLMALAGCDALPDSGPTEAAIIHHAKDAKTNPLGFHIVDIDPRVVSILAAQPEPALSTLDRVGGGALFDADRIGPGDTLAISIFELGNGLFAGGGNSVGGSGALLGSASPNATVTTETLPTLMVNESGRVTVPYIGQIEAAGRTPEQLAAAIEGGLRGKSQNPQVIVRITKDLANSIMIYGDLRKPGRLDLTLAHERLLDAIALSGGPNASPEDTEVRVTREGVTGGVPLRTLEEDADQNILLRAGDRIEVLYRPRTYTVFGATPKDSEVKFDVANLTLADALARIGGPSDDRADPNAVFVFRFENAQTAADLGEGVRPGARTAPVLYRIDMMDPTSYFLAQRFMMQNKDLIYIANAKTNRLYKFMSLINLLAGPALEGILIGRD